LSIAGVSAVVTVELCPGVPSALTDLATVGIEVPVIANAYCGLGMSAAIGIETGAVGRICAAWAIGDALAADGSSASLELVAFGSIFCATTSAVEVLLARALADVVAAAAVVIGIGWTPPAAAVTSELLAETTGSTAVLPADDVAVCGSAVLSSVSPVTAAWPLNVSCTVIDPAS
jgi:hypothetical protein